MHAVLTKGRVDKLEEQKVDIKSLSAGQLEAFLNGLGQPKYRAAQIFKWLHLGTADFEQMSDIPKSLRGQLAELAFITCPETVRVQKSKLDGTVKYLRSFDGSLAESVLMKYKHGNTVCVSSQSGCRMGCAFCASTVCGLERSLRPSEILDQVIFMQKQENVKISNIVLMGTGEPLDNYDNVLKFLRLVNHPLGLNIGHRHISLSTCGIADKIDALAGEKLQITLSVSLHAPFDEIRSKIMPVNKAYPINTLIRSCRNYFEKTGRRISFEYAMIDKVNDNERCARELARIIKGMAAHVNLIPLNRVKESGLCGSDSKTVLKFQKTLEGLGVTTTVRRTLGSDIDASCGQLRNREINKNTEG